MKVEITLFAKSHGILSKRIALRDGKLDADGSHCRMSQGEGRRVQLDGVASLAEVIGRLRSHEALALGRLRPDLPEQVKVVLKAELVDTTPANVIARTQEFIEFAEAQPAYMLLDHDHKGAPRSVADRLKEAGGFWPALVQVIPALANAAYVQRPSTSAWLFDDQTIDNKEWLTKVSGEHVYLAVTDGADIERAPKCLHARLWLAGYGYHVVNAIGQLLDRSIIDVAVCYPERLVFEAPPMLVPPVAQDAKRRRPLVHEGEVIDTKAVFADLTAAECEQVATLQAESAARLKGESAARRKQWAVDNAPRLGVSVQRAEQIAAQALKHTLEVEFELTFDDPELGRCTVAEVIGDPDRYVGETLADPLEGTDYGRGKAKVLARYDRCLVIHSFAHGGINYELAGQGVRLEAFRAYKPMHNYIYTPTRMAWPASSVDATIPPVKLFDKDGNPMIDNKGKQKSIPASQWLDQHQSVEVMTWAPGRPMLIEDWLIMEGGWVRRNGVTTLNLYRPPTIKLGDARKAEPWLDHVHKIYPDDAEHMFNVLAHRVQRPEEKINHSLLLIGYQGIGKDTLLVPVRYAVGPHNFEEVSPRQFMGRFNGFLKSVVLRVNELRDVEERERYAFYDHLKWITATPPEGLPIDEKNLREYRIVNCVFVIMTTNYKTGIHLPHDDRRTYVAWSNLRKEDFEADYFPKLYKWYYDGGNEHVAAFLMERDLAKFDAKAHPPQTPAFWEIVGAGQAPEHGEMAGVLEAMKEPAAVTIDDIVSAADGDFREWLEDRKNRRLIAHRLEDCGYTAIHNPDRQDGLWKVLNKPKVIYGRADRSQKERLQAAQELIKERDSEARRWRKGPG
jgi:hypothetical protein